MNEHLRGRIARKLEALSDERGYQVLDYVEFLETKYAESQSSTANAFTRFQDAVEDKLRAGRVSASTIAETIGLMNRAATVLTGAMAAANEFVGTAAQAVKTEGTASRDASSPAHETKSPGSGEEKL